MWTDRHVTAPTELSGAKAGGLCWCGCQVAGSHLALVACLPESGISTFSPAGWGPAGAAVVSTGPGGLTEPREH